jgi:hypothetical protein
MGQSKPIRPIRPIRSIIRKSDQLVGNSRKTHSLLIEGIRPKLTNNEIREEELTRYEIKGFS